MALNKLIKTTFKLVDSRQEESVPNEHGFITQMRERRMFVIITRGQRPEPESLPKMTDRQQVDLFRIFDSV
jgi:hypothetical protein